MTVRVSVLQLTPDRFADWDRFVSEAPAGSPYSTAEYLDILCGATGARFRVLAALRGDEIVGGVALYEVVGRFGPTVVPRLLLYYNGLVLKQHETRYPSLRSSREVEVLTALEDSLSAAGYARLALKCRAPIADVRPFQLRGWSAHPAYTYVVSLDDLAAQWQCVEQNLRRLVKRCENEGLRLVEDDDFDAFYRMHESTHARKGAALYLPRPAFESYFRRLHAAGRGRLYHARRPDGRSIAAQLVLTGAHRVSHTVSAGADPEFIASGASAFLRWKALEALAGLGYTANDLTDAGLGSVGHFKSQLGGRLEPYFVLSRPEAMLLRLADGTRSFIRRLTRTTS
jgi:hypothetical protein